MNKVPLAIVGMGCRLPGARDLDEYWQLLVDGRSAIGELPRERLDRELYYDPRRGERGKTYTTLGGVVEHGRFDPLSYPLPSRTLAHADVSQVAFCQVVADAYRHAGWNPFETPHRKAGVYVGHTTGGRMGGELTYATCAAETAEHLRQLESFRQLAGSRQDEILQEIIRDLRRGRPRRNAAGHPLLMASLAAALITDAFDLDGPSMVLDSACSSSLQALAFAARDLWLDQVDLAIVGGASYLGSDALVLFSNAQSVTAGKSCPFDAAADGFVAAEGQVAVLVKRLDRALADGNAIHAVIRGIGVSSDGRGKSLWAPLESGQRTAIRRAYCDGVDMARLQFVEAHATSTQAGDITELTALASVLKEEVPAGTRIPVGGVKANIGHTLETAGLAGLVKTVLAMQHGVVPRQINVNTLNPQIPWDEVPLFVPLENVPWTRHTDGHPRRAAVNAFGVGGLNVHVVLDEFSASSCDAGSCSPGRESISSQSSHAITGSNREKIAIVGLGGIFPGARTVEALWDLLATGRDPKCEVPADRWNRQLSFDPTAKKPFHSRTTLGGFITGYEYDWKRHRIPPKQISRADPLQFMILDAVDAAFCEAGWDVKQLNRDRIGVVVGTAFGSDFSSHFQVVVRLPEFQHVLAEVLRRHGVREELIEQSCREFGDFLVERLPMLQDETGSFTPSSLASRITKTFDLHGGAVSIDVGHNSSMAAIAAAQNMLRVGDCDMVICAAGSRAMGLPAYESLSLSGDLCLDAPKPPFDQHANGVVPGEGVGVLLLKKLSHAQQDGDKIRAVIAGLGVCGGFSPEESLRQAMARSLEESGLDPQDVHAIETASVGLKKDDYDELQAVRAVYGDRSPSQNLVLGSTCSQLGHLQSSMGMLAAIKSILAMEHRQWPVTPGLTNPSHWCQAGDGPIRLATEKHALPAAEDGGSTAVGVDSWNSAGGSYHLLLTGTPVQSDKETAGDAVSTVPAVSKANVSGWRIVRIGGRTPEQLAARAAEVTGKLQDAFERANAQPFNRADRFRLALVAQHPEDLAEKLKLAIDQGLCACERPDALERKGIYLGERSEVRPRVAFMFSGQGSQYPQMLKNLVAEFEPAAQVMSRLDATLSEYKYPEFADLAWDHFEALGCDLWRTQLSILVAGTILSQSLEVLGIRPDMVGCLSYGEFPALVAAGAWTFSAAAQATDARCRIVDECGETAGALLAVPRGPDEMQTHIQQVGGRIYVANITAFDQTVIGGEVESIKRLAGYLRKQKIASRLLTVPHAFHTPLMREVIVPFRKALSDIPIQAPRVPILSSVSQQFARQPDEIRDNLSKQMTEPVDYWKIFRQTLDEGIGALVEVGPASVLTDLHRKLLSHAGRSIPVVASDNKTRGGLAQLLSVQACLECCGALEPAAESAVPVVKPAADKPPAVDRDEAKPAAATHGASQGQPTSSSPAPTEVPRTLRLVEMAGTPYEMGLAHGRAQADSIRRILRRFADASGEAWNPLRAVDTGGAEPESYFGAEELDELQGIADGAQISRSNIIAHNLQLYSAQGAGCFHFAVNGKANPRYGPLHCVNDDVPLALIVRCPLGRAAQIRHPRGGIPHVTFAVAGQLAGAVGVNARGLAVSSTILLDRSHGLRPGGLLHGALVKRILERAEDLDSALAIIGRGPGANAWGICLSHFPTDELCYLEYDGATLRLQRGRNAAVAANHSMILDRDAEPPAHSKNRLARWESLVGGRWPTDMDAAGAQAVLRDRYDVARGKVPRNATMNSIRRTDNQQSIVLQPSRGEVWVTGAPQGEGRFSGTADEDQFQRLDLSVLLAEPVRGTEHSRPSDVVSAAPVGQPSAPLQARSEPGVCSRYVLRTVAAPLPENASARVPWSGAALIVGQNAVSRALKAELQRNGTAAFELPQIDDVQATRAALDQIWEKNAAPHLFLVTACDPDAVTDLGEAAWQHRRRQGVIIPYFVCQQWLHRVQDAGLLEQASVVAVTQLGGDFGFSGPVRAAEGGALAGLIKALRVEFGAARGLLGKFRTKAIDAGGNMSPEMLAACVVSELAGDALEAEISYVDGRRHVVRPFAQPAADLPGSTPPRGGTWVVTGGARGITAAIARELGRRLDLHLHLLGSGERPQIEPAWRDLGPEELLALRQQICKEAAQRGEVPIEAWKRTARALEVDRNLRAFEQAGVSACYHRCDVADRGSLAAVLNTIRDQHGPIEGIIHGAGFEQACAFHKKQAQLVDRTIAAKVDGAAALMELTHQDPLRFFVGFGSISGRFGGAGQTDYCLANEMLSKLVDWYQQARPDCRATTIMWHSWDEIGMAARPESRSAPALRGMKFLPPDEGIEHMASELWQNLPEREILITDPQLCEVVYPDMSERAQQPLPDPLVINSAAEAKVASPPAAKAERDTQEVVARRHVVRLTADPREGDGPGRFAGAGGAIILGDNPDAAALRSLLSAQDVPVHYLVPDNDVEQSLAQLQELWRAGPAPNLFIMTARDREAAWIHDAASWSKRRQNGIVLPYLFCQRWLDLVKESELSDRATLVAVTSLDGDFGFRQGAIAPEGGALTGLLKSIALEQSAAGLVVKVIDAPADETPAELAANVLRELTTGPSQIEVSWTGGCRYVPVICEAPLEVAQPENIERGSVWVATGGARGITASCMFALAGKYGLRCHLIGRRDAGTFPAAWQELSREQIEPLKRSFLGTTRNKQRLAEWEAALRAHEMTRNLQRFEQAGIKATYHVCDLQDAGQLAATLERIRREDGPISGIVHGAGTVGGFTRMQHMRSEDLFEAIDIKATALVNLMHLTQHDPLRWLIGFGSIAGRLGAAGRTDYVLASELLCKLIGWFRRRKPDCLATSFHWYPWGETGMMTSGAAAGVRNQLPLMSPAEGNRHFLAELEGGAPDNEVVIMAPAEAREAPMPANPPAPAPLAVKPPQTLDAFPLLDSVTPGSDEKLPAVHLHLDPVRDPFLREHRFRDRPMMPIVMASEAFAQAATFHAGDQRTVVGLRDIEVVNTLRLFEDHEVKVTVQSTRLGDTVACQLTSPLRLKNQKVGLPDRVHLRGTVELGAECEPIHASLQERPPFWYDVSYPDSIAIYHGAPFRCLRLSALEENGAWGRIVAPHPEELMGARRGRTLIVPAAVLDACFYQCGILVWFQDDGSVAIPQSFRRLRLQRQPFYREECIVRIRRTAKLPHHSEFDFTLFGEDGSVILQVEGYQAVFVPTRSLKGEAT